MSNTEIGEHFKVILIGKSRDQFIRYALEVLETYDVITVRSRDIYSAATEIAGTGPDKQAVIGRYELLNREDGRFLEKLRKKA